LLGFQREEMLALTFASLLTEDQFLLAEQVIEEIRAAGRQKQSTEFRLRRKTGGYILVETQSSLIYREGKPFAIQGIARDITERRRSEDRIRQQAALLEATHDAVLVCDLARGIQFMNPAAEALTGMTFVEAQSQELIAVLRARREIDLRAAFQDVTVRREWTGELELLTRDGKCRNVASRWTSLADAQGNACSILITCNDITEKKQLEIQYLRAQRLESIGTLASGVAHDLNNILSPIIMGMDLLKKEGADPQTTTVLAMMQESACRGSEIVKQLLTFARGAEAKQGPVQPRHLVREIVRLIRETFPKNLQIYTDYAQEPGTVLADPSQLHQVLMNLCVNARDAMPDGGVLLITLENLTLDASCVTLHPKARPIPYVVFKVADSGIGIPPEILDRIFDPFFTTKPQGKGTGLGLATVLGIVQSHEGFVLVDSQPGQGTIFRVHIPAAATAEVSAEKPKDIESFNGHGETILLVDDEPAILRMAENVLRRAGYETLACTHTSEAVHLYERNYDRIRAVVTDIMMPFADGRQLITLLYENNPQLPIIAMSGMMSEEFQRETMTRGACAFLAKPFDAEELLSVLHRVIHSHPASSN